MPALFFCINAREDLIATTQFPNGMKKRSMFFLKKSRHVSEKLAQDLIIGDLSGSQLDHLSVLIEEIYLPLLQNQRNVEAWPEVVVEDVIRHFEKLNGSVYVINGQAKVGEKGVWPGVSCVALTQSTSSSNNRARRFCRCQPRPTAVMRTKLHCIRSRTPVWSDTNPSQMPTDKLTPR